MTRPILHGSNISPFVRKVRVALAYKGIEYDNTQQNPFGAPPKYRAKSPLSKIPCWEEGELILPDSSVILSYLEHRYPDPPLVPTAPAPMWPAWLMSWWPKGTNWLGPESRIPVPMERFAASTFATLMASWCSSTPPNRNAH